MFTKLYEMLFLKVHEIIHNTTKMDLKKWIYSI